jgi:DNA-directed RNA polymerase specialized sigma24 family protein
MPTTPEALDTGDQLDLHEHLRLLSDPTALPPDRRRSATAIEVFVRAWLPGFLRIRFPRLATSDSVADIAGHVVDRASAGTQRFRGEHKRASALAWLSTVAANRARDALRRMARESARLHKLREAEESDRVEAREQEENMAATQKILALVSTHVRAAYTREAGKKILQRIHIALAPTWSNVRTAELLLDFGYLPPGPHAVDLSPKTAASLLYKHRQRAREKLGKILALLVSTGKVDAQDAARFAAVNRVPVPWPVAGMNGSPTRELDSLSDGSAPERLGIAHHR